jgi:hypothetical protein
MILNKLSIYFGRRFRPSKPAHLHKSVTERCQITFYKKFVKYSYNVIHEHDKELEGTLEEYPDNLGNMILPSKKNCFTAVNYNYLTIRLVPWYHIKAILRKHPKLMAYLKHDDWGIADLSKELVNLHYTNIKYCHKEHYPELFKMFFGDAKVNDEKFKFATENLEYIKYMNYDTDEKMDFLMDFIGRNCYKRSMIRLLPWHHIKAVLRKHPEFMIWLKHDDLGIADLSKELVNLHYTNIKYCHKEHYPELFKMFFGDAKVDDEKFKFATENLEYIKYIDYDTDEKMDFLKDLIASNYGYITFCPENKVSELLPLILPGLFDDPDNFKCLVLSGKDFNQYFAKKNKFYKVTNSNEKHHNLKLRTGLIIDPEPFNRTDDCKGGIYFTHRPENWACLYCCGIRMCHLRGVVVPDDAIVRIESDKVKADKLILLDPITDTFNSQFDYKNT